VRLINQIQKGSRREDKGKGREGRILKKGGGGGGRDIPSSGQYRPKSVDVYEGTEQEEKGGERGRRREEDRREGTKRGKRERRRNIPHFLATWPLWSNLKFAVHCPKIELIFSA
jgi:hypothetical protein